jgi:hypothetical protein
MQTDPPTIADAVAEIERLRAANQDLSRRVAWAEGRRGDGAHRAPGFTVSETRILRVLASTGFVAPDQVEALQRHMSNVRRKLRENHPSVTIRTVIMEGYELASGRDDLRKLLLARTEGDGSQAPAQRPTPTERVLAERAEKKALAR